MSVEAAAGGRETTAAARSRTLADRVYAVLPLLSVFFWLCVVYAWQAWDHGTPWLFGDELEMTQIARSLADTGHAARRGVPYSVHSLYTLLIAPAWWLHGVDRAYSAVKYIGVVTMTLTAFPAYFLARTVASPRASLAAAAASVAIPGLVYSSFIVDEPVAYAWSTLSLLLIAYALISRRRRWIAAAALASLLAPFWKGELAVVPGIFVLAAVLLWWSGDRASRWRSSWSAGDWVGAVVLILGIVFLLSAFAQWRSAQYLEVTRLWKTRVLDHAVKAGGALTIGLGVLPTLVAGGTLLRAPGEQPSRELRVFRSLLIASIVAFGLYTGIKGAYNQNHFATRIWERNEMYLAPLFFAALALWLDRRRLNLLGLAVAAGYTAYVLAKMPYEMVNQRFASDAPGMTILSQANRSFAVTPAIAEIGLFAIFAASLVVLLLPQLVRLPARAGVGLAAFVAVFVVAWNFTGELSSASASNAISRAFRANIRGNPSWVDHYAHGQPTLYLAQTEEIQPDQTSEWLLEFWNRSIKQVWILGGCPITFCGPGPTVTPDVVTTGGRLFPQPGYRYVVVEPGIVPDGTLVARHAHKGGGGFRLWRLYRVHQPLQLKAVQTGLYDDGWSEPTGTAYTRFRKGTGTLRIDVSRKLWGGPSHPYHVTIKMGTLAIGSDHQPRIGRVTQIRRLTMTKNYVSRTVTLHSSTPRFRVEVTVTPPFVPAEELPQVSSDRRQLGAVVGYRFSPSKSS